MDNPALDTSEFSDHPHMVTDDYPNDDAVTDDYPNDHPNDHVVRNDLPNGHTVRDDFPNGHTVRDDFPNGHTVRDDFPNGHAVMDGGNAIRLEDNPPFSGIGSLNESTTDSEDPVGITVPRVASHASITVTPVQETVRERNPIQSVEFSPTLTKASFRYRSPSGDSQIAVRPMDRPINNQNLSRQMLVVYLQHLGNAMYFMLLMSLGFIYPLHNALSYGKAEYKNAKVQFEILMIIVHSFSILMLTLLVVRLTLRKSDEDRQHGEGLNFFLRIGAIVFCIGVIILNILRALEPVELLLVYHCIDKVEPTHITYYILSVVFYALQTYFMFKYHKTTFLSGPNKHEKHYVVQLFFIRFAMMHMIAVNLVHWLNSVMWEAAELFESANHKFNNVTIHHHSHAHGNRTCESSVYQKLSAKKAQAYLFPCVIEYSLIAASALLAMYIRVGAVEKKRIFFKLTHSGLPTIYTSLADADSDSKDEPTEENITVQTTTMNEVFSPPTLTRDNGFLRLPSRFSGCAGNGQAAVDSDAMSNITTATSAAINKAMGGRPTCKHPRVCEKSHVGFFVGIMLLAGGIVCIACEFIFEQKLKSLALLKIIVISIWSWHYLVGILLTVYLAFRLTTTFRFEFRLSVVMEKLLLYVTYFGNLIFLLLCAKADVDNISTAAYYSLSVRALNVVNDLIQIIQETFQAAFIFYGLNLRACTVAQRRSKLGRTALTITIFLNMIIWLRESLLLKSIIIAQQYVHYYGLLPWCMVSSTCFPLIIFYRFHSASLLSEIWTRAYD